jgi:glucokinase
MKRLGIDLGGTYIKIGIVQQEQLIEMETGPTPIQEGYNAVVQRISEMVHPLLRKYPEVKQAGVGSPGIIDTEAGVICYSNNFKWRDKPLRQDLVRTLGLDVCIANDVHCATLGEALYGAGQTYGRVAMLTIGTGIGGGFIQNGKLETDRYGSMAYILGHVVTQLNGLQCNCGRRGCLEAYASASAIANKWQLRSGQKTSVRETFEAAREGDAVAQTIVNEFADYLAEGVVNIANTLRPHVIILGGGVSASCDLFLQTLNDRLEEGVYGYVYAPVKAVKAALGDTAGIVGAAGLCDNIT